MQPEHLWASRRCFQGLWGPPATTHCVKEAFRHCNTNWKRQRHSCALPLKTGAGLGSQEWWHTPRIPAFKRPREMNQQSKARMGYVSRPCLKKTKVVKDLRKLRNSKEEKRGKGKLNWDCTRQRRFSDSMKCALLNQILENTLVDKQIEIQRISGN